MNSTRAAKLFWFDSLVSVFLLSADHSAISPSPGNTRPASADAGIVSALIVRNRIDNLDLVAVLKTRE